MHKSADSKTPTHVTQVARGDKNVQIVGDNNVVDNRTYVFRLAGKAQITYRISPAERTTDGSYKRTLTLESTGTIPVYRPRLHLRFSGPIESVKQEFTGMLADIHESATAGQVEYTFSCSEFPLGLTVDFVVMSGAEVTITEFGMNDNRVF